MPSPTASPSFPTVHTASTIRRLPPPSTLAVPLAADGMVPDHELETCWAAVKERLSVVQQTILSNHTVRTEPRYWADVYTDVANLYTQNDSARKRRMYVYIRTFVKELVAAQLAHLQELDGSLLLSEYCRAWRLSMRFVCYMKRVLHHLHRFWIRDHANTLKIDPIRPLDKLLMFYWREDLLSKLCNIITISMRLVAADRTGQKVDHAIVRGVVDTLVTIGQADVPSPDSLSSTTADPSASSQSNLSLYIRLFEDEFLELTRMFYKKEGEKMVAVGDVSSFMRSVLARLAEEDERGKRLLHPDSAPRLRRATEQQLIGNHLAYLQEEAKAMIREGREDDLKLVYTLLKSIENGLAPLRTYFSAFVREEGSAVVVEHIDKMGRRTDMQNNLKFIRVLVRLHRKHSSMVQRCFDGSNIIMMAIDDAFRCFANRTLGTVSLPVLIAHYVDRLLRLGTRFDREMWNIAENADEKQPQENKVDGVEFARGSRLSPLRNACGSTDQVESGASTAELPASQCKDKEGANPTLKEKKRLWKYFGELVRLFMYLDDKDLFFETHRRLFAKRLMTYHDEELETHFIFKVKTEMGPTFTQRLSGMLKDKLVSNMTREKFSNYLQSKREQFKELKEQRSTRVDPQDPGTSFDYLMVHPNQRHLVGGSQIHLPQITAPSGYVDKSGPSHDNAVFANRLNSGRDDGHNVSLLAHVANIAALKLRRARGQSSVGQESNQDDDGEDTLEEEESDKYIIKGIDDIDALDEALRIDFNAHVLNALHWPAAKAVDLHLPPALKACQQMFTDFYMQDRETRKLSWIHNLSSVSMTANFGGKQYMLSMSTFQASALMLFNDRDSISVGDACEALNISKDELAEHVKPLFLGRKCRLLNLERIQETEVEEEGTSKNDSGDEGEIESVDGSKKRALGVNVVDMGNGKRRRTGGVERLGGKVGSESQLETQSGENECISSATGDEVAVVSRTRESAARNCDEVRRVVQNNHDDITIRAQDILHLNTGFESRTIRIVVPTSVARMETAEVAASKRHVAVDRNTQVDAALVRIMKAKREMTHVDLSAEVISTLSPMFVPEIRLIKSRLERLIEQEYLERDANDPKLYRYAA